MKKERISLLMKFLGVDDWDLTLGVTREETSQLFGRVVDKWYLVYVGANKEFHFETWRGGLSGKLFPSKSSGVITDPEKIGKLEKFLVADLEQQAKVRIVDTLLNNRLDEALASLSDPLPPSTVERDAVKVFCRIYVAFTDLPPKAKAQVGEFMRVVSGPGATVQEKNLAIDAILRYIKVKDLLK